MIEIIIIGVGAAISLVLLAILRELRAQSIAMPVAGMKIEYSVLEGGSLEQLAAAVGRSILEGWQPQGGVCSYTIEHKDGYGVRCVESWFCQALVKP